MKTRIARSLRRRSLLSFAGIALALSSPALAQNAGTDFTQIAQQHDAAFQSGDYARAISLSTQLIALAEQQRGTASTEYVVALIINGADLVSLGRNGDAETVLLRATNQAQATFGPTHKLTLFAVQNLTAALIGQGKYRDAEPLIRTNLDAASAQFGPSAPNTLKVRATLAANLQLQGKLGDAEALFRIIESETAGLLPDSDPDRIGAISNLAAVLIELARFGEAEPLIRKAYDLATASFGERHPTTLSTLNNLATALDGQGRLSEGEPLLSRVATLRGEVLGPTHPDTLLSLNNLAQNLIAQGRYADAEVIARKSVAAAAQSVGAGHVYAIDSLHALASALSGQGKASEAEPLMRQVVAQSTATLGAQNPATLASTESLAILLNRVGKRAEAETMLRAVAQSRTTLLGPSNLNTLISQANLAGVMLTQPTHAGDAIFPARLAASGLRQRIGALGFSPADEAALARDQGAQRTAFDRLADSAWITGLINPGQIAPLRSEAFTALQDAMAGSTSRAIGMMAARNAAADGGSAIADLARQHQQLTDQWVASEEALTATFAASGPDVPARRELLRRQQAETAAQLNSIDTRLRAQAPAYFALTRPSALQIAQAQALLAPDEAALMVVPTEFGTHIVAISRTDIKWHRADLTRSAVATTVKALRAALDPDEIARTGTDFERARAFALYQAIIQPIESVLAGKRHVFIAADGALASLPFGVLVTAAPEGKDDDADAVRATHWLADNYALIQLPSLQSLQFLRGMQHAPGTSDPATMFQGFGDPTLGGVAATRGKGGVPRTLLKSVFASGQTRSGGAIADVGKLRELARLPGTATELDRIRTALGAPVSTLHLQDAATEALVRSTDLTRARVIAFATHGLLAGELKGSVEPGLVFTPPAQASEADDGLLTASEITTLKLNADLVVLSACNSGSGDGSGTPPLSGLARAFFYAGANALLVSHWPVYDDVAPRITTELVAATRADPKLSRAEALQRAIHAVRTDTADPSLAFPSAWAPFVIVGDGAR